MAEGKPADYKATIDNHKHESLAVLVASESECIGGFHNIAVSGREFEVEGPGLEFDPPSQVVVIIVLCPGDDLGPVMGWIEQHAISPAERVFIVFHPDCDLPEQLVPWYAIFDRDPIAYEMEAYPGLREGEERNVAQRIGEWYNDWIYLDAKDRAWPLW